MRAKTSAFFALSMLFGWLVVGVLYPQNAYAGQAFAPYPTVINPADGAICPIQEYDGTYAAKLQNKATFGIAKRVVYCVKGVVIPATMKVLNSIFQYLVNTITVACTLALIFWGYMMATGKRSAPLRDAYMVALKIGAVIMFTNMLGKSPIFPNGLYPILLDIVDWLISVVSSYAYYSTSLPCAKFVPRGDMWGLVDCMLETLIGGILSPTSIMFGVVGFFTAALFSGPFGLFIAGFGFAIIFILVFAIARAVYIVISAYIAISLLAMVSPIFITCILFSTTRGYFEKWLKLLIGFIIQPMFLFAYISMLLVAYDVVIYKGPYSVYRAIAGNVVDVPGFQMGSWLFNTGVYKEASAAAIGVGVDPKRDAQFDATNTGVFGGAGNMQLDPDAIKNNQEQNALGQFKNIIDTFTTNNVFKVDIPVTRIDWFGLAVARNQINTSGLTFDEANAFRIAYLVNLFLALMIALITIYIFFLLLDLLPYIGGGISGESLSMPVLGQGKTAMPGNGWANKLKASIMGATGGGGTP